MHSRGYAAIEWPRAELKRLYGISRPGFAARRFGGTSAGLEKRSLVAFQSDCSKTLRRCWKKSLAKSKPATKESRSRSNLVRTLRLSKRSGQSFQRFD